MRPLRPLWPGFEYKPHQVFGVRWMLQREKSEGARGGVLADEMGLGKTIQMIGLMRNGVQRPREQNLLVAPVAVLEQWKTVARRAGLTVKVPTEGAVSWALEGPVASVLAPELHIVGYEMVTRHPEIILHYTWHRVIYDEAHRLGGHKTSCGDIAEKLTAPHIWLLTATPIVNDTANLSRLLKIIGVPKGNHDAAATYKTYILARSMDQLRASIPDAPPRPAYKEITLEFKTTEEAEFYRGMTGIITRRWRAIEADGGAGAALERLKLFMRLRQLSLHPQVYIAARKKALGDRYPREDWAGSSTKFDALQELVGKEPGRRWIFFCHFHTEMEMLKAAFEANPLVGRVQIYNGTLSAAEKEAVLAATHTPLQAWQSDILLVQLQSGGVGLNLQHFNRVVFTGPWWTKALMEQAVGRAVRIGQREQVVVYHVSLAEEEALNIDVYMQEKADAKGELCRTVLEKATTTVTAVGE